MYFNNLFKNITIKMKMIQFPEYEFRYKKMRKHN